MSHLTLYELTDEFRLAQEQLEAFAIENGGAIDGFPFEEAMAKIKMDREKKIIQIGLWILNLEANAAAIAAEIERQKKREKQLENKVKRLGEYLTNNLDQNEKIFDSRLTVKLAKLPLSVKPQIKPEEMPKEYLKTPAPEISLSALKEKMVEVDELVFDELGLPVYESAPIEEQLEGHAPLERKQLTRKAKVVMHEFAEPVIGEDGLPVVDHETGDPETKPAWKIIARMVGGFKLNLKGV
jgi:hypothetical protein